MDERQVIAEGLAALATTYFEMGSSTEEARINVLAQWSRLGSPRGAFDDAVGAMRTMPQPLVESAAETERRQPVRDMLGMPDASSQLTAALAAAELLQELADETR